ncbi:chaplin [Streptomyces sp. NRRL F-2747]|uniref:chaplin n=1 Tax=Streptomyces sp. NRRL F-2747 TaxID=1463843 RepID=UPI00055DF2A1|nr:chaplin [Streptomyces sp. NRRL F-2747]
MVAGGGLAVAGVGGFAFADADAGGQAERSPGLLAGNLVQLPVHTPVNVCGNTVSVVGLLNSAAGNRCANQGGGGDGRQGSVSSHPSKPGTGAGSGSHTGGGAHADGSGKDSPGLLSGNGIQLPVDVPLNVSGNSVSVVGVGNGSTGNTSVNGGEPSGGKPVQPPVVEPPVVEPPVVERPATPTAPSQQGPSLAHTGADGVGYLLPGGGALLLGGMLLYRRFRLQ